MADYTSNATTTQQNNSKPGSIKESKKDKRTTLNLLPEYIQTDTNKKFLNATLDQMILSGTPIIKSGHIGKKIGSIRNSIDDVYLTSKTVNNNRYQLDPTVISQNVSTLEYDAAIPYEDIINKLKYQGSQTTNLDKLFSDYNYSWKPPLDYDMFVNWNSYVWLPVGLPLIGLHGETRANIQNKQTHTTSFQIIHGNRQLTLENGMRLAFSDDNKTYLVTGVGSNIDLVDESTLCSVSPDTMGIATPTLATGTVDTSSGAVASPTITDAGTNYTYKPFTNVYDSTGGPNTHAILQCEVSATGTLENLSATGIGVGYATSGVDLIFMGGQLARPPYINANKDITYKHQYICMERVARDNNQWSRSNNWYHIETVKSVNKMLGLTQSFKIDGLITDADYAQRPIICWERDLQVHNYGTHYIAPVDIIITEAIDPADSANGWRLVDSSGPQAETHDDYVVQANDRVLFTNSTNATYKNKIFTVNSNVTGAGGLTPATDGRGSGAPTNGDVITCLNGTTLIGKDYWFNGKTQTWIECQSKSTANSSIKFELYDTTFQLLSEYNETDFLGNTVFEYLEDKTSSSRDEDTYLGFPLTYASTNYLSSTNTSNLMFNNSLQETIYQYDRSSSPKDILGFYYLKKYDRELQKHNFDNCWKQSYKQIRTPITVTQDVTNAEDDFVIDLGTTNFEPERDYWLEANRYGWNFCLKSAYDNEELAGLNPTLYLAKNKSYTFEVTNGQTNFQIQDSGGTIYSGNSSITNNNTNDATITFNITSDETNTTLYYSAPDSTTGKIVILEESQEQGWPEVFHNGNKLKRNIHYIFNGKNVVIPYESAGTDETVSSGGVPVFSPAEQTQSTDNLLVVGDIVDVKFYTTDTSITDEWAYDVPGQLKNNPGNEILGQTQYAEIFNHFTDVIDKQPGLIGNAFGNNNFRNSYKSKKFGGLINQQLSSLLKLGLTLSNEDYDVLLALDYNADNYDVFKRKFTQKIEQLYASMAPGTKISALVDQALYDLNLGKNNTFPFANSDMAYYFNMVEKTYTVTGSTDTFTLPKTVTKTKQYQNHVYVYVIDSNGIETFLTSDLYTLNITAGTVTLDTAVSSGKVTIKVSIDEALSFIPPTLAKLGITPAIKPTHYVDTTGQRSVIVLEGHDGSKIIANKSTITGAGSTLTGTITDYRDKALLELENRIYNNIMPQFKSNRKDLSKLPGKYRTTSYTRKNYNDFYDNYFNSFRMSKGIQDLTNTSYDESKPFTHNYASTQTEGIGFWRGIYNYYFDTDRPHTHPWEMLGFVEKPNWWDANYEWFNVTMRNKLISALQRGVISDPTITSLPDVQDINVARPGATFPVAADGTLQDPATWGVTAPSGKSGSDNFKFGDSSPIETVWRRSSLFPFRENQFLFSTNPSNYLEKHYDTLDRITDGATDVMIKVTSALKSGSTTDNVYYFDGIQQKKLVFEKGKKYTFDLTDVSVSNSTHDFELSITYDGSRNGGSIYTTGWDETTPTYPTFTPAPSAPDVVYYYNAQQDDYGGTIEIIDVAQENQIISNKTKKRHNSSDLYIHNEVDTTNLSRRVIGLQQLIVDRLMFLGNDLYINFAKQLRQLSTKLSYKMQGFSKKSSISLLADSLQSEKSNNFVPPDDITIKFHISSPYKEYIYSGIEIVSTDNGYKVYGFNNAKPYFTVLKQLKETISQIIISNTNIQKFTEYSTDTERIEYGTEYKSINDVYNFLDSYSKYLELIGFQFTNTNEDDSYEDFEMASQQFVIWGESNWGTNTSIKISPAGNMLHFNHTHGHIKSNDYEYGSFFLDENKSLFNSTTIDVDRQLNYVTVKPKNNDQAIYCASLVVCDYEHLLIINNKTIFDDIIYYPILGDAKQRFKIEYLQTPDWNGTLHAPGYLVVGDNIYENFDKTTSNITDSYFNVEESILNKNIINVARKNIGYEKKQFLRNMRLSDDSQFQFMKGVNHLKGTPEVFNRLTRSTFLLEASVDINLEEEWIFRLGEFGPETKQTTQEFILNKPEIKTNPQLIDFGQSYVGQATDMDYDDIINMLPGDSRWLEQPTTTPAITFTTRAKFDQSVDTIVEIETYEKDLPNAGYPKLEETTYQMFHLDNLPTLYDTYKDDDTSVLSKLIAAPNWKDTYTYAENYYVRYNGKRWRSNRIINAAAKSIQGVVNANYSVFHSDGSLKEVVLEKCVFTADGVTKVSNDSTSSAYDPFIGGQTGVNARLGSYNHTYYPIQARLPQGSSSTGIVSTGADANKDYSYVLQFAEGTIPAANAPADDSIIYINAFNYKTDAEAGNTTILDRWTEVGEEGIFNVWIADTGSGDWSVLNLQDNDYGCELICKGYETGDEALIKLNKEHNLVVGDYVLITGCEYNPDLNGIHKVTGFPTGSDCDTCGLRSTKQFYIDEYVGDNELYGKVFPLRNVRFDNTSDLYSAVTDTKYKFNTLEYAYVDNAFTTQEMIIGQVDTSGSYNPYATSEQTFAAITDYTLAYSTTTANVDVFVGSFRTKIPQQANNISNYTVIGNSISFNSVNIGSAWGAGQPLLIIYKDRNNGYGTYQYNATSKTWAIGRSQKEKADTAQLANIIVYDHKQNRELARAETWDPYKGIIPGLAEKEIEIISGYDQALYNATTQDKETLTTTRSWGGNQIGTTWWNLNTVRYIDYEQSDDQDYTFKNWGKQFPGSSIDIYEWTKSPVTPDEWITVVQGEFSLDGEIASGEAYTKTLSGVTHYYWCEEEAIDPYTGSGITFYYFWVKNKTSIPKSRPYRELSCNAVAEYLDNPTNSGLFWASPSGTSSIITGNIADHLTSNSVFQINFSSEIADKHKEWIKIKETNTDTEIQERFALRMHESLLGIDEHKDTLTLAGVEQTNSNAINTFNYEWNNKLNYNAEDVVKVTSGGIKYYKALTDIKLISTNLKLAIDNQTSTINLKIGLNEAQNFNFPAKVIIDSPPPASNIFGLPYENVTAYAYPNIVSGTIDSLTIVRGGQGYSTNTKPKVWIEEPYGDGTRATVTDADLTIVNGVITGITMDASRKGSGYADSYAVIDQDELDEEIVKLKYFDDWATRQYTSDFDALVNGSFELKTADTWSVSAGSINPSGKVLTTALTSALGSTYAAGVTYDTTGGTGTGFTCSVTVDGSGAIQTVTIVNGGGGYTVNDTLYLVGGDSLAAITVSTVNTSDIIYGNASGLYTGTGNNTTHYVGIKGLTVADGVGDTINYLGKALIKADTQLDSVKLKYGSINADGAFNTYTAVDLTPTTSSQNSSLTASKVYAFTGEFTSTSNTYHALWLEIIPGHTNGFTVLIDNLQFINPSTGDRIIVERGQQSTSAVAHDQFSTFKELGTFSRQPWFQLLNYTFIDDKTLTVDAPNMVPSLRLNEIFRYGGQIRPYKQSWIKDKLKAIRVLLQKANKLLLTINLVDSQLNWKKNLGDTFTKGEATFSPQDYWDYTDWFHPDYTVSSSSVAQITATTRNELYDVDNDLYSVVRVDTDDIEGNWAFYQWVNESWLKIGKQNGTIQLKDTLFNVQTVDSGWDAAEWDVAGWDKNYTNELAAILKGLHEDIFIGPYKLYYKQLFFALIRYIYSEQTNLDWVAKTTFLELNRKTPGELKPRSFDVGAEQDILDYLNEVKPYHSKVETIFDTRTFEEETNINADEVVDIRVQTNTSAGTETVDSRAFRMFIDNTGTRIYEAIINNNKTTAGEDIDATETAITVTDATKLPGSTTEPGEIMIEAERIRYTGKSGNTLTGCVRGIGGTAATTHANGTSIVSAGPTMGLPVTPDPESYPAFNATPSVTIAGASTLQGITVGEGTI